MISIYNYIYATIFFVALELIFFHNIKISITTSKQEENIVFRKSKNRNHILKCMLTSLAMLILTNINKIFAHVGTYAHR